MAGTTGGAGSYLFQRPFYGLPHPRGPILTMTGLRQYPLRYSRLLLHNLPENTPMN
jgi:hypothetical protein